MKQIKIDNAMSKSFAEFLSEDIVNKTKPKESYEGLDDFLNCQGAWPDNATAALKVEDQENKISYLEFFNSNDEMVAWLTDEAFKKGKKLVTMYIWDLGPNLIGTMKIGK